MVDQAVARSVERAAVAFESYRSDIRRYFGHRLDSGEDALDLTQEVCLRFLAGAERSWPQQPRPYLFGIARHVLADFLTARGRECSLEDVDLDALSPGSTQASAVFRDPLESLVIQQQASLILLKLPIRHRQVLIAQACDGYSYEEVASKLGLTKGTVEKYLTLAKAHARSLGRCR